MKIFKSACQLVDDIFFMHLIENSVFDCLEDVTFQMLKQQINILSVLGRDDPLQSHHIVVFQFPQESNLPVYPLSVYLILKGEKYFFDGKNEGGGSLSDFPNMPVSATPYLADNFKSGFDGLVQKIVFVGWGCLR